MKMSRAFLLSLLLTLVALPLASQTGLKAFLPAEDEMPGWKTGDEVKIYKGSELIFFVNREADLLKEYGFEEVMAAELVNERGEEIELEIYRMTDVYASYGVYLLKSDGLEWEYDAGNESVMSNNSLVLWKHHYIAVIRNKDEKGADDTGSLTALADIIDSRIRIPGRWPKISHTFRDAPGRITLIRGKIALQNIYYFTSKDVFRIEEGYAIEKPGQTDIFLKYGDSFTSIRRFGEVAGVLSREKKFSGFTMVGETSFRMRDTDGNDISVESEDNYLNIRIRANAVSSGSDTW